MLKANWLKLTGSGLLIWILSSIYTLTSFGGLYLLSRLSVPLILYLPYLWFILAPPTIVAWLLYTRTVSIFHRHRCEDEVLTKDLDDKQREIDRLNDQIASIASISVTATPATTP